MKVKPLWPFHLPPFLTRLTRWISERSFGLKAKITLLILLVVTGTLLIASYFDGD